jgi:putative Mg2+ transporter-C (MgtC) family protein
MQFIAIHRVELQILIHVGMAMLLGAAIGLEREIEDKPAGLRTHMLVAGAAALLVALGDIVVRRSEAGLSSGLVRSDPIRIIQAVVTGVSFLGAGTILRRRAAHQVEGLTTAASVLFAAAVGTCVALSQWVLALGATVLVLATLRGLGFVQRSLECRNTESHRDFKD